MKCDALLPTLNVALYTAVVKSLVTTWYVQLYSYECCIHFNDAYVSCVEPSDVKIM
jgi:hypothetical protein